MKIFARTAALIIAIRALKGSRDAPPVTPAPHLGPRPAQEVPTTPSPQPRKTQRPRESSQGPEPDAALIAASGDAPADTPLDLEARDWKQTLKRTLKEIKNDRVPLVAAGMAYYFFLAIFPAIIALVGVLGLVEAPQVTEAIRQRASTMLPGGAGEVLTSAFENADAPSEGASLVAASIGIAAALWSTSSGFVGLQSGLNIAYDIELDRKFLGKRGVAFLLIILTLLLGGVPSPFFTFGESTIFVVIGWILSVAAVIVLFSAFYAIGPKKETPGWQWVSPGGLVGAAMWIVASIAFGFYTTNFGSYTETYGALADVIVLIFWLFLSSVAILIGGELNSELEQQRKTTPSPA